MKVITFLGLIFLVLLVLVPNALGQQAEIPEITTLAAEDAIAGLGCVTTESGRTLYVAASIRTVADEKGIQSYSLILSPQQGDDPIFTEGQRAGLYLASASFSWREDGSIFLHVVGFGQLWILPADPNIRLGIAALQSPPLSGNFRVYLVGLRHGSLELLLFPEAYRFY